MCAKARAGVGGGGRRWTGGRDGHLYTRLSVRAGGGDTLPSDRGPRARGGLGIFQHAPLHE